MISFSNWKRGCGKTTALKLKFHELQSMYTHICAFGFNPQSTANLYRYCCTYRHTTEVVSDLDNIRGLSKGKLLVLIDEPFLIPEYKQADILQLIDVISARIEVCVIGIGTNDAQPFSKYII